MHKKSAESGGFTCTKKPLRFGEGFAGKGRCRDFDDSNSRVSICIQFHHGCNPNFQHALPSSHVRLSIPPWMQPKPHCEHQTNQDFFIIPNPQKVCEPGVLQKPREVHRLRFTIQKKYPSVTDLVLLTPIKAGALPCECLCHCNEMSGEWLPAVSLTQYPPWIQLNRGPQRRNGRVFLTHNTTMDPTQPPL